MSSRTISVAPIDWRIDDHNVVQPDVAIFCQPPTAPISIRRRRSWWRCSRRPPPTELAGVKFYLIVEPHDQFADIFELVSGKFRFKTQALYGERVTFPFGETCQSGVDFGKVFDPPLEEPSFSGDQSTNRPS